MKKLFVILIALFVIGIPAPAQAMHQDTCVDDLIDLGVGLCVPGGPELPRLPEFPNLNPSPSPTKPPSTSNPKPRGGSGGSKDSSRSQSNQPNPQLTPAQRKVIAEKKAKKKKAEAKAEESAGPASDYHPTYKPAVSEEVGTGIFIAYIVVGIIGIGSTYVLLFYPRHRTYTIDTDE